MSLSENTSEINMLEDGVEGIRIPPVVDAETGPSDEAVIEEPEEIRIPPVFNLETESDDAAIEEPGEIRIPPVFNLEAESDDAAIEEPGEIRIPPVFNLEAESDDAVEEAADDESEEEILLPPEPEESTPFYGSAEGMNLTWWGFSQQGESHLKNDLPCQDRCTVLVSEGERTVIIAAIADGVGSCALSHYGASTAVNVSAAFLKEAFDQHQGELEDKWVGDHLRQAMALAQESVAKAASDMQQLEYSFQSTLTIGVYDGSTGTLYIGHIGDDGVVVVEGENTELVTTRHKGEEASSVYPLQSGPAYWQVMKVDRCVSGFVLATDGVLDAFVRPEREHNRVYYPFIQPAFETRQETEELLKETVDFYNDYMAGASYRRTVTDDLTMVVVTNQQLLVENGVPVFDSAAWAAETEEYQRKAYAALYPDKKEHAEEDDAPEMVNAPEASEHEEESSAAKTPAEERIKEEPAEEVFEPFGNETYEDEKVDETEEPDSAEEVKTANKILPYLLIIGGALALAAIFKIIV